MLFSSITFLYFFLPAVLLIYYAVPFKFKNFILLAASVLFYFWGEPKLLWLLLFSIVSGYVHGLLMDKFRGKILGKVFFISSLVITIGLLVFFKYADFIISNVNLLMTAESSIPLLKIALPVGISFYTFQLLSYLIDVYMGRTEVQRNFISLATYVALFPQLIAGPIVRYTEVEIELRTRVHSIERFSKGVFRFAVGLAKKILIANQLGALVDTFRSSSERSVLFCWMYGIAVCLQIYYDFSGYSDMAIGLGAMFGFTFPENFDYPYISTSITEFWRRWHMTLGRWFRDYVYIPMGGSRVNAFRRIFNIFVVWCLTGLWHGAAWNFVIWGLYFAILLALEKQFIMKILNRIPRVFRHVYLLFLVLISFMIFNADTMSQAFSDISGLFYGQLYGTETIYYLRSYGVLLIVGIFGATPIIKNLCMKLRAKAEASSDDTGTGKKALMSGKTAAIITAAAEPVAMLAMLVICTAYLVDGSFNPFLYFRF